MSEGNGKDACPEREADLGALLFGELDDNARQDLERHLVECEGCGRALEEAALGLSGLKALSEPPMPYVPRTLDSERRDNAWADFEKRLALSKARAPELRARSASSTTRRALAAAALVVLGVGIGRWGVPSQATPPTAAPARQEDFRLEPGSVDALARAELLSDLGVRYARGLDNLLRNVSELNDERATPGDLAGTRDRARELLGDGRLLKRSLDRQADASFLKVVARGEIFLEELAAVEDDGTGTDLRVVQASLKKSSLPKEVASLDVESKVALALEASSSLGDESGKDGLR